MVHNALFFHFKWCIRMLMYILCRAFWNPSTQLILFCDVTWRHDVMSWPLFSCLDSWHRRKHNNHTILRHTLPAYFQLRLTILDDNFLGALPKWQRRANYFYTFFMSYTICIQRVWNEAAWHTRQSKETNWIFTCFIIFITYYYINPKRMNCGVNKGTCIFILRVTILRVATVCFLLIMWMRQYFYLVLCSCCGIPPIVPCPHGSL